MAETTTRSVPWRKPVLSRGDAMATRANPCRFPPTRESTALVTLGAMASESAV